MHFALSPALPASEGYIAHPFFQILNTKTAAQNSSTNRRQVFYIRTQKTAQPKGGKCFTSGHHNNRKKLSPKEASVLHQDIRKTAQNSSKKKRRQVFHIWTPKQQHKRAQPRGGKCFTSEHQNNRTKQLNQKEVSVLHQDTITTEKKAELKRGVCFTYGHQNNSTNSSTIMR